MRAVVKIDIMSGDGEVTTLYQVTIATDQEAEEQQCRGRCQQPKKANQFPYFVCYKNYWPIYKKIDATSILFQDQQNILNERPIVFKNILSVPCPMRRSDRLVGLQNQSDYRDGQFGHVDGGGDHGGDDDHDESGDVYGQFYVEGDYSCGGDGGDSEGGGGR